MKKLRNLMGLKMHLLIICCPVACLSRLTCTLSLHSPSGKTPTASRWCSWSCDDSWLARKTWNFHSHPKARSTPTENPPLPLLLLSLYSFSAPWNIPWLTLHNKHTFTPTATDQEETCKGTHTFKILSNHECFSPDTGPSPSYHLDFFVDWTHWGMLCPLFVQILYMFFFLLLFV